MDKLSKKAWLLVEILKTEDDLSTVRGKLADESLFTIKVSKWAIEPREERPGYGWITVDYHGTHNNRASITLPSPILDKGHKISVKANDVNVLRIQL